MGNTSDALHLLDHHKGDVVLPGHVLPESIDGLGDGRKQLLGGARVSSADDLAEPLLPEHFALWIYTLPDAVRADDNDLAGLPTVVPLLLKGPGLVNPEGNSSSHEFGERIRGRVIEYCRIVPRPHPPDLSLHPVHEHKKEG